MYSCVFRMAIAVGLLMAAAGRTADGASFYTERLDDPRAIYLTKEAFGARGDGVHDDAEAIQRAINRVVETTTRGIVFIPQGQYRLSRTLYVWPGVRLIGYGRSRPTFLLGERTPGFQGVAAYVVHFTGATPGYPWSAGFVFQPSGRPKPTMDFSEPVRDANPGTFYSAISNIDIEIREGNPAAVAVRATYAQHCFLAHMEMRLGSALAGVHDGGNVIENVRFIGGRYGVITRTPSPGWQFTIIDSSFERQSVAAIQSRLSGLTLIRPQFRDTPIAITMSAELGEQLWLKDARMENIADAALVIGNENNPRNQLNVENLVAANTPTFARFHNGDRRFTAPADRYRVARFSHGLHIEGSGERVEELRTESRIEIEPLSSLPRLAASDLTPPPPQGSWVNVQSVGVKGDGRTDDTQALRQAIGRHRTLYFPMGAYKISDTLRLRADTALIGLHAGATRIFIEDGTPAFRGVGKAAPMIETPKGGHNILMGLGVYTNGSNPRAAGVKWMAGERSLMNDVRFLGGHGTAQLSGDPEVMYNENKTADPDPQRRWDSQYPSLWITDGGGGTFLDIWTPSPYAQSGMLISNTSTPGRVYQMSSEHHVRAEVKLDRVANWELYALQLEEERGESGFALPVEISRSRNITLANLFTYRVISSFQPFPMAVKVSDSDDIRFRNFHCWSNSKAIFDSAVIDPVNGLDIRQHEFAWATLADRPVKRTGAAPSAVLDGEVRRLSSGFFQLSGGVVDAKGRYYAVDAHWQRIYRWTDMSSTAELISDAPLEPVNLAADQSGELLVVSRAGAVYSINPDAPTESLHVLAAQPAAARAGLTAIMPQNYWTNGYEVARGRWPRNVAHYVSRDGSTFIPAGEDFVTGKLSWGVKDHDLLRANGYTAVKPGQRAFFTLEWHGKTYAATLDAGGDWGAPKLFAERGGEAVAVDEAGNVYIAEGRIFVYRATGELIEIISVPERPLGLTFGGPDRRTLYIPAGSSLYGVRTRYAGR